MGINIRNKGQNAEREIADMLNYIVYQVMKELGYTEDECLKGIQTIQRNQLQTAVGGNDLTSCFGMSIEVKRQEQLSINTWWRQCCDSAAAKKELPVLLYRQNRKAWRAVTLVWLPSPTGNNWSQCRAEFDIEPFKQWFKDWVRQKLLTSGTVMA